MRQTGFSDTAWGKATHGYAKSARALANSKFEAIIKDVQEFMKPICARNRDPTDVIIIDDDDDDERACLVDNSESGSETA
jgi:spermidine synthase